MLPVISFSLALADSRDTNVKQLMATTENTWQFEMGSATITLSPDRILILDADHVAWSASLIAPARVAAEPVVAEVVEWGQHYCWRA